MVYNRIIFLFSLGGGGHKIRLMVAENVTSQQIGGVIARVREPVTLKEKGGRKKKKKPSKIIKLLIKVVLKFPETCLNRVLTENLSCSVSFVKL